MEEYLQSRLSSWVSFPVAWGTLGSGTSTPRAVMFRTSGVRSMHMGGTGNMTSRVQIDCYGASYAEAIEASRDIRAALEGLRDGPIQGAFLQAVRDQFDEDAGLLHRVSLTFSIHHRD